MAFPAKNMSNRAFSVTGEVSVTSDKTVLSRTTKILPCQLKRGEIKAIYPEVVELNRIKEASVKFRN